MKKISKLNIALIAGAITLSMASFSNAQEQESNENGADRKEMKKGYHKGKKGKKGKYGAMRAKMMLEKVDSNQDGNVDLDEYLAHATERFNTLDLDSNGFVTQEEAKEAMKKMRQEHKERRKEMWKKRKQESEQESE